MRPPVLQGVTTRLHARSSRHRAGRRRTARTPRCTARGRRIRRRTPGSGRSPLPPRQFRQRRGAAGRPRPARRALQPHRRHSAPIAEHRPQRRQQARGADFRLPYRRRHPYLPRAIRRRPIYHSPAASSNAAAAGSAGTAASYMVNVARVVLPPDHRPSSVRVSGYSCTSSASTHNATPPDV